MTPTKFVLSYTNTHTRRERRYCGEICTAGAGPGAGAGQGRHGRKGRLKHVHTACVRACVCVCVFFVYHREAREVSLTRTVDEG